MEIVQFSSGMNLRGEHHDGHGSDCTDDLSLRLDTADYLEQSLDLFEQGKLEMAETKLQNAFRSFRRIKPDNFNNPSDQEKILVERGRKVFQRKISVQNFGVVLMDQLTSRDDSKFYATFINVFDALARKLRRYDLVLDISKARTDFFRGIASNEKDVDLVGASESDQAIFRIIMMKTDNQPVLGQNLENFSSMVIENGFLSFEEVTGNGRGFFTTENESVNCQDETANPLTNSEVRTSKVQATTPPNISKDADGLAERPTYPSQTETEEESSGWLSTEGSAVGGLGLVNRNANRSEDGKSGDCKPTVGETSSISERKLKEKQEREETMKKNEQTRPLWNDKAEMPEEVRPQDEIQNAIERKQSNFLGLDPCFLARHSVHSSITTPFDDVRNTAESANRGFSNTFSKHQSIDISKTRTDFFRGNASNEKDVDLVGASESDEGIFRNIMMKTDYQPVLGQNLENFSSMVIENGFLSFGEVTGYGCGFFTTENESVNCQDKTTNPLTISEVRTSKVQATTPPDISKDADGLAERPTYPSQTETEEETSGWLSTEGSAVGGLGLVNRNTNRSEDDKSGDCKPTVGETSSISERKLKEKQEREKTMKKNEQTRPLWNDKAEMPEVVRPQDEIQNTIERNQSNFFSVRPCLFARHSVDSSITTPFDDVRNTAESANRGFSDTFSKHQGSSCFTDKQGYLTCETSKLADQDTANQGPLGILKETSSLSKDDSLADQERRVAVNCSLVEKTLREREVKEKTMKQKERRGIEDRARKEKQAHENREREATESRETERSNLREEGNSTSGGRETLQQMIMSETSCLERKWRERDEESMKKKGWAWKERFQDRQNGNQSEKMSSTGVESDRSISQNSAGAAAYNWQCEHHQRLCLFKFPCCKIFFPCNVCHANSGCRNVDAKERDARFVKCSVCGNQQQINQDAQTCARCKTTFSAYFCSICKIFTGLEEDPFHCTKCGCCRIHKDHSFHCDVCNVCIDKGLEGRHKCRPNSEHDECFICLEDTFHGCQILPCTHKVHRECAIVMKRNGVRSCPICSHPL